LAVVLQIQNFSSLSSPSFSGSRGGTVSRSCCWVRDLRGAAAGVAAGEEREKLRRSPRGGPCAVKQGEGAGAGARRRGAPVENHGSSRAGAHLADDIKEDDQHGDGSRGKRQCSDEAGGGREIRPKPPYLAMEAQVGALLELLLVS